MGYAPLGITTFSQNHRPDRELGRNRWLRAYEHMARSCQRLGTKVEFTSRGSNRRFASEQTWGRAVRASQNSKEFGALLIWGHICRSFELLASTEKKRKPQPSNEPPADPPPPSS